MKFGKNELMQILISWLVLSFCFSTGAIMHPKLLAVTFFIAMLTLGLGFVVHEMSHKFIAQKLGYWAEYRLWIEGLLLALIFSLLTRGIFVFAAPGAVYITPLVYFESYYDSRRDNGLISVAGPLSNVVLALTFFIFKLFIPLFHTVWNLGYQVNLWLALFNLIPIPPLDGSKVFAWNKLFWAVVTLPLVALVFLL